MQTWKRWVLGTYLYGTLPYRSLANHYAAHAGRAPVMVLFYHRVADDDPTPWTISNAAFARQVQWLQQHFDLVSLEEAQRRLRSGENHRPAVSNTFDDGYADNCRQALPLLIKERIPVTYFVSTQQVLEGKPFPHDVSRGQPLDPNTLAQLRALAAAGVEIGAHSRTHIDLGKLHDNQRLFDEVVLAARDLQTAVRRPVRYFAFPFGHPQNLNPIAVQMARQAGFEAVCSAYGGYNFPGDDPFHLQRIHADPESVRLRNWLTVDPLRCRSDNRFATTQSAARHAVASCVTKSEADADRAAKPARLDSSRTR